MKKALVEFAKFMGAAGFLASIATVLVVFVIFTTPPQPIVSVEYHGQEEVRVQDVRAVLVWDEVKGDYVPVANPQEWFANYEGRYEISYAPPSSGEEGN